MATLRQVVDIECKRRTGSFSLAPVGRRQRRSGGFSLVEVVIALAVMASSFLVVFGLLGVGLNTFHQSKGISVSAQIAQQVFSQLQSIQFANLTGSSGSLASRSASPPASPQYTTTITSTSGGGTTTTTLYFDEQGNQLNTQTGSVYWVNVRVAYPTPLPPATLTSGSYPAGSLDADLATVLVQVVYNPGGVTPAADGTSAWTGLSSTGAALQLYNYQFFVARNS